jgi:glycosyltransferase involved in cell wall biosynthesis
VTATFRLRAGEPSDGDRVNPIVVPTYQEALTIGDLLDRLLDVPALADFHVLVVDDASPDGTASTVAAHPAYLTRVHRRVQEQAA